MIILLLEDSEEDADTFVSYANISGYQQVEVVPTVERGLGFILDNSLSYENFIAFVDIGLRGESGFEFLRKINDLNINIPVAMLSDTDEKEDVFLAGQLGACAFFEKELMRSDLDFRESIGKALKTYNARRSRQNEQYSRRVSSVIDLTREFMHDMKNCFTPIKSCGSEILDSSDLSYIYEEATQVILMADRGEKYLNVLDDLIISGRIHIRRENVDFIDAIRAVWPRVEKNGFTINIDQAEAHQYSVDRHGLNNILFAIFTNAITHVDPPALISVSIKKIAEGTGNYVQLTISDNGQGIMPVHREAVFEPGTRLNGEKPGGLGLGLTIARRWTELHSLPGRDARIRIIDRLDGAPGACFLVRLPI